MPNVYLSLFKHITYIPGFTLWFSPVYDNYGWGEPFYDTQIPPVAIDEPYGSTLSAGTTQDDRNKIAKVTSSSASDIFSAQENVFPGNQTWTNEDNTKTLTWWSFYGYAGVRDLIVAEWAKPKFNFGDIGLYLVSVSDASVRIITSITGSAVSYESLSDLNDKVWVNGVMHTLPTFHPGHYGRWITGCGMIGDWVIYIDANMPLKTGSYITTTEYVNAYNTTTLEYKLLGTYQNVSTEPFFNMANVSFSQNGTMFISQRNEDMSDTQSINESMEGAISLDLSGDPDGLVVTRGVYTSPNLNLFYWGYKNNVVDIRGYLNTPMIYDFEVHDWDVATGGIYGYLHDRQSEPAPTNYPQYLVTGFNERISIYSIDYDTGIPDLSAPYAQWPDLSSFLSGASVRAAIAVSVYTPATFIPNAGAFITFRRTESYAFGLGVNNDRVNGLFEEDGSYTDLGELLLTSAANGPRLCCSPHVWGKTDDN